jgi:hypothetical protein
MGVDVVIRARRTGTIGSGCQARAVMECRIIHQVEVCAISAAIAGPIVEPDKAGVLVQVSSNGAGNRYAIQEGLRSRALGGSGRALAR